MTKKVPITKKVKNHLKDDIKGFRYEIKEDKELLKSLQNKRAPKKK